MRHLFVLAGAPHRYGAFADAAFRRKVASEVGDLAVVTLPKGAPSATYALPYIETLLEQTADWVSDRSEAEAFSVSLLAGTRDDQPVDALFRAFFPFALIRTHSALRDVSSPNDLRRELNRLAKELAAQCTALRSDAKVLREHFEARLRKTPLLLPCDNFGSSTLLGVLRLIQMDAATRPMSQLLQNQIQVFNGHTERQRWRNEDDEFYANGDGLIFRSARLSELHGAPSRDGHPSGCFLRARTRVGSSFNPKFHYDCVPARGRLRKSYPSCHEQYACADSAHHINISPNDFVRG